MIEKFNTYKIKKRSLKSNYWIKKSDDGIIIFEKERSRLLRRKSFRRHPFRRHPFRRKFISSKIISSTIISSKVYFVDGLFRRQFISTTIHVNLHVLQCHQLCLEKRELIDDNNCLLCLCGIGLLTY